MNNFKNMSKKKSFCNALFNEFFGSILLVLFITYIAAFIILGKAGIFNFIGGDSNIANGFVAAVFFPIVLGLVLLAIVLIVSVLGFIPHKVIILCLQILFHFYKERLKVKFMNFYEILA